ncbi:FAD-dependent monooxygenase [Amycolatopsis sp. CA-230715]|uniref:FAD-dependent monooxygenase n=1 Tax=Amycolatopsis sp. CA-230715 TaxID=2745196 RepID=UPI001C0253FC|nr:FAD-dependent monooxygenase [Amycolatopsis sp. CA-230715]QWF78996.1 Aurachin C monooxygenase/isomerase [Amycolatopsis sp. CA-230715]
MGGTAIVIGAGIGGLCAAIGLREAGWEVRVLERAERMGSVGAGIGLWPNALHALDELGVGERIRPLVPPPGTGTMRDRRGRVLVHWDNRELHTALGKPLAGVHRADLLEALLGALPEGTVHTGIEVTGVTANGTVRSAGGEAEADLVIGADGVRSVVRNALWPAHPGPVHGGSTAFRAVLDDVPDGVVSTVVGAGTEFGTLPLAGDRLYWYASMRAAPGVTREDPKAFLLKHFDGWPPGTRDLIDRTPSDRVLHNDLAHLRTPLASYATGKVVLLGDAAHAMLPFLGQGGCLAIEDATVLASLLSRHPVPEALARYDAERRPRTQKLVRLARRAGQASLVANPVAVAARNQLVRLLPSRGHVRRLSVPARWRPPAIVSPSPDRPRRR